MTHAFPLQPLPQHMTHKQRLSIRDDDGEHLMAVYVEPDANSFEGADLTGLIAIGIKNLRGTNFALACFYWANLEQADLSGCNFEGADFRGSRLQNACLAKANLRDAKLGKDNRGGATSLLGTDLTGAQLHGADLRAAEYDSRTIPGRFQP